GKKIMFFTWAQNNTPVNKNLLKNMEAFAKKLNASISVIAGRYRNPTSQWTTHQSDNEFWDSSVIKYLDAARHVVHDKMTIMSDVKIQPTAVNPLSGLYGLSKGNSCIFGHPKVHLEVL